MPSGLQIRPMEERAPKPMRSAYGSQVEQFFAPSMRKWYGEEGVDRRVDAMQGLYEEYGSPQFAFRPEEDDRRGSYDPWSRKVLLKQHLPILLLVFLLLHVGNRLYLHPPNFF